MVVSAESKSAKPEVARHGFTLTDRMTRLEGAVSHLSASIGRIAKYLKIDHRKNPEGDTTEGTDNSTDGRTIKVEIAPKMNTSDLEDRVTVLEVQMATVLDDVVSIQGDQSVQNYRLDEAETNIQSIQGDLATVEESVTTLFANDENIQSSIAQLEQVDEELTSNIDQLTSALGESNDEIASLDSRMAKQEVDGAIAFHAYLGVYSSITPGSTVVFPYVNVNLGNGYSGSTGKFTVPSGGAGLYYLYVHVMYDWGDWVYIGIRKNGSVLCYATNDDLTDALDHDGSSCGAVSVLEEGKLAW